MKSKFILMFIITGLPLSAFAGYSYYHKLPSYESINFVNKGDTSEEGNEEGGEQCPETHSTPIVSDGYPIISRSGNLVSYDTMFKTDGGFITSSGYADSSTRYKKTILVEVYLNDGSMYTTTHNAEEIAYFIAQPGRDLNLRVKSGFYDTKYGFYCSYGTSVALINKTYDKLK